MTSAQLGVLFVIDFVVAVAITAVIGIWAPHWPTRWLARNWGPLAPLPFETPTFFRRLGVPWLAAHMPEAGALFGGESKKALPGTDVEALSSYLVEVRRAELVHMGSMLSWLPLIFFNPWWMTVLFALIVAVGVNLPFLLILRYNNVRLTRLLARARIQQI